MPEPGYTYIVLFHSPAEDEAGITKQTGITALRDTIQAAYDEGYFGGNFLVVNRYEDTKNHFWKKWRERA